MRGGIVVLIIAILLAIGLWFLSPWRAGPQAAQPTRIACAPDQVALSLGARRFSLPFDTRLSLSPKDRRHVVHALKTQKGQTAYCRASQDGARAFAAAQVFLFSRAQTEDALCPQSDLRFADFCRAGVQPIRRLAVAKVNPDAPDLATTADDFAADRARDPWKSERFVLEAAGQVTRYADEYREIRRAGAAPLVARCWTVGAAFQCDVSEVRAGDLRVDWTILAPKDQAGTALVRASERVEVFLEATGLN